MHPATAVWGVFDEPVDMSRGVPQSYYVDEFAADGFVFEGIAGPPDYLALAAPFAGDALRELMLALPPRRPVRADGQRPLARAGRERARAAASSATTSAPRDTATFHAGLLRLTELMGAAGARRVVLPVARVPELRDGDRRRCASSTCGRATSS